MSDALLAAFLRETNQCLLSNVERIEHCVAQLNDEQIWHRPAPGMNSIGNLILHLRGNVRQWIVSGLTEAEDDRNRPQEFAENGPIARQTLLDQLRETVTAAVSVLEGIDEAGLLQPRRIQGFELDGVGAIFDCVPHFKGHTQEIICLTRMQLGDQYQFYWQPSTAEEGAPQ